MPAAFAEPGKALIVALTVGFSILSLYVNPFQFDESHNARYLIPVLQASDPTLYPNDEVAGAIERFRSIYYDVWSWAARTGRLSVSELPVAMKAGYAVLLLLQYATLFAIARLWSLRLGAFLLLGIWASQRHDSLFGGDGFFIATLTHREVAMWAGFLSIFLALRQQRTWAAITIAGIMFVHPLTAMHLAICLSPLLFFGRRIRWLEMAGNAGIVFCSLVGYFIILKPPRFNTEEMSLFLRMKGDINHISLAGNSALTWFIAAGMLSLAMVLKKALWAKDRIAAMLRDCAVVGTVIPVGLSLLYSAGIHPIALLQPLRAFTWVTVFTSLLVIASIERAWERSGVGAALLLGTLACQMAGLALSLPYLMIALLYWTVWLWHLDRLSQRTTVGTADELMRRMNAGMVVCLTLMAIGAQTVQFTSWFMRFESLRNPLTPLIAWLIAAFACWTLRPMRNYRSVPFALAGLLLILPFTALPGRSESIRAADWEAVTSWVRDNTENDDRFLTPPGTARFHFYALRTAVAEPWSALAWVDPHAAFRLDQRARLVQAAYERDACDLPRLLTLAREWRAAFLITKGRCSGQTIPVATFGQFNVYRLP